MVEPGMSSWTPATDSAMPHRREKAPTRLAKTMAEQRRIGTALAIEDAALDLFASRPTGDVTMDDIAEAAAVATRTIYGYFQTKDDILLAYPRRWAQQAAQATLARPGTESAFVAVREALKHDDADPQETARWVQAVQRSDARARIARNALEAIASSFAEAIAVRSGLPVEDLQVQMAGRMVADAIDVGALRSAQGDAMAVFAAWEIAGTGIANLGLQVRRRRPGKSHTLVPSKTVQEKGGQS